MIKIPAGYRQLNTDELVLKGDEFKWNESGGWSRKLPTPIQCSYKMGDDIIVGGQKGKIHSPRFYLETGYGYVIKLNKPYSYSNWDFEGITNGYCSLSCFREDLIKLAPKSKTVKLNETYTAEVFKDKVVVGCQEFPYEVIKEIVKSHDSI